MKKYFVVSDIHSFYTELKKELYKKGFRVNNKEHILILCGDAFDRSSEAVKMYKFLKKLNNQNRLIYIRGNHEDLFVKAAREHIDSKNHSIFWRKAHFENGGKPTFNKWRADGCPENILNQLDKLEESAVYENINNKLS